jgi:putative ABC transport system substrate-binding protein
MLHEPVPNARAIGVLVNPDFPDAKTQLRLLQTAASALGLQLHIENANTENDCDIAFANFANQRVGAVSSKAAHCFSVIDKSSWR